MTAGEAWRLCDLNKKIKIQTDETVAMLKTSRVSHSSFFCSSLISVPCHSFVFSSLSLLPLPLHLSPAFTTFLFWSFSSIFSLRSLFLSLICLISSFACFALLTSQPSPPTFFWPSSILDFTLIWTDTNLAALILTVGTNWSNEGAKVMGKCFH